MTKILVAILGFFAQVTLCMHEPWAAGVFAVGMLYTGINGILGQKK